MIALTAMALWALSLLLLQGKRQKPLPLIFGCKRKAFGWETGQRRLDPTLRGLKKVKTLCSQLIVFKK